jgi:phosphate starvation-inducible membrane PsiE
VTDQQACKARLTARQLMLVLNAMLVMAFVFLVAILVKDVVDTRPPE